MTWWRRVKAAAMSSESSLPPGSPVRMRARTVPARPPLPNTPAAAVAAAPASPAGDTPMPIDQSPAASNASVRVVTATASRG